MNKKAHGLDTILAIVTVFGLALTALMGIYSYNEFVTAANQSTTFNQTPQAIDAMVTAQQANYMWDYVILVIFIGFAMAMMILGYFVDVHTIFFPIFVIVMLVGVLIAGVLSYTWERVADTSAFTVLKSTRFPITNHLLMNLTIYYTIIAGLALITTYAKTRGREGY